MFIWPTDTKRITSYFRASRSNHHGIDIANPGTHPIYASAPGKVTRSYTSTSYGECIFILHNMNGQHFETVYAHMRSGSRKVKVGQQVKAGQSIGIMGNTGHSTGQHLHFELHKGLWNVNKTNAVDPLKYINKDLATPSSDEKWTKVTGDWTGQTLKPGQHGNPVKQLQTMLANNKPPFYPNKGAKNNGIDGFYGGNTANAVRRYQTYYSLAVDGLAGKEMYNSLKGKKKKSSKSKPKEKKFPLPGGALRRGNKGNRVKQLQRALNAAHFKVGKVDGIYGQKTENAISRFQKVYDAYYVDGVYGSRTRKRLDKIVN